MRLAFRFIVIALLLAACAQVKPLEGGPRDEAAPVPFGVYPPNGSTNFSGQAIAITFDEYVKLNNPTQTISIIPNDVKIKSELKDKTLMLYWTEPLRENTTYSIYFNKTLQDVNEANDSILQYVFSTGPYIDSLSYSTFVIDALNGQPKKNCVVGLFEHPDSLQPLYFGLTDNNGQATLNYLKEGNYYVRAFDDASKRGKITKNDGVAYKEEPVQPAVKLVDSAALKLFKPLAKPKITTFEYVAPRCLAIGANRIVENGKLYLNDTLISQENIKYYEKDSILVFYRPQENTSIRLQIATDEWTDSTKLRVPKTKTKNSAVYSEHQNIFPNQPIVLTIFDKIDGVDTSKLVVYNPTDSTEIKNYNYQIANNNELHLVLPDFKGERVKITLQSGAIKASQGWTQQEYSAVFTKRFEKEFGTLNVNIQHYTQPIIFELLLAGKTVKKEMVAGDKKLQFTWLEPGEYSYRITVDANNNQRWDTGDFEQKIQPEEIHLYSTTTKVRANWEVDVELEPVQKK